MNDNTDIRFDKKDFLLLGLVEAVCFATVWFYNDQVQQRGIHIFSKTSIASVVMLMIFISLWHMLAKDNIESKSHIVKLTLAIAASLIITLVLFWFNPAESLSLLVLVTCWFGITLWALLVRHDSDNSSARESSPKRTSSRRVRHPATTSLPVQNREPRTTVGGITLS